MASTDALPLPRNGAAYQHSFCIRKNDGTLITTWAGMDSKISKDNGTFVDCTNEAIELATTSGCGYLLLTPTEMTADIVVVKVTVTNTDALPYVVTIYPEEVGDFRTAVTSWNGVALATTNPLPNAAPDAAGGLPISAAGGLAMDDLTPSLIADQVWDELQIDHVDVGTFGEIASEIEIIDGLVDVILTISWLTTATITDVSPTTTGFDTDLNKPDGFYNDTLLLFYDGPLGGQTRLVTDFTNAGGRITFDEPTTSVPSNGDQFMLKVAHQHSVSQIATGVKDAVWDALLVDHADPGSTGAALSAAGVAGDPWIADLSTYAMGEAGLVLHDAILSLGTPSVDISADIAMNLGKLDDIIGFVDTLEDTLATNLDMPVSALDSTMSISNIKAKTDQLMFIDSRLNVDLGGLGGTTLLPDEIASWHTFYNFNGSVKTVNNVGVPGTALLASDVRDYIEANPITVITDGASRTASQADLAGIVTETHLDSVLPTNFTAMVIDVSGTPVANIIEVTGTAVTDIDDFKGTGGTGTITIATDQAF